MMTKINKCKPSSVVLALVLVLAVSSAYAQPVLIPNSQLKPAIGGNSISHVRIVSSGDGGTEAQLTMHYKYDGLHGNSVRLIPMIQSSTVPGAHRWFGVDPVEVPRGKGIVSMKIRFFNDEADVPARVVTDRIRVLFVHSNGHLVISTIPVLKTIRWGAAETVSLARTIAVAP